jgi:hypothetical protein
MFDEDDIPHSDPQRQAEDQFDDDYMRVLGRDRSGGASIRDPNLLALPRGPQHIDRIARRQARLIGKEKHI